MRNLFLVLLLGFSIPIYSKNIDEKELSKTTEKKPNQKMKIWCEVRGVYSKFTGDNGVVNHVCSFVSQNAICYYVPCGEWGSVGTIQSDVPVGIDIEEGTEFIAVPTLDGIQITYLNGFSYTVENNTLTIIPN